MYTANYYFIILFYDYFQAWCPSIRPSEKQICATTLRRVPSGSS